MLATGLAGEILRDDVIRQAQQASVFRNIKTPEWPADREDRIPVKGVRKAIATAMVNSAFTAPHVSVFTDVNATRTMEFVKRLKNSPDFAGVRVSPLLVHGEGDHLGGAPQPDRELELGRTRRSSSGTTSTSASPRRPRAGSIVPNVKEAQSLSACSTSPPVARATSR